MKSIVATGLTKDFDRGGGRFRALDQLSFEAEPGEVIGIIGRNGAGKSTLLKILSRILRPTSGRVVLRGRVGSLLEAGSGFHPELTGRENVFLNAAILGMREAEIRSKLDAIVDFAGTGHVLDEPLRTYSSGMQVRLAFSVAAHIEPEILLIDEVLAVGDSEFQKKCIDRIEGIGKRGLTVLFVSHNMQAVLRLSTRAMLLEHGALIASGPPGEVAAAYSQAGAGNLGVRQYPPGPYAPGDQVARLRQVRVRDRDGATLNAVDLASEFGVEMHFELLRGGIRVFPVISLNNEWGTEVLCSNGAGSVGQGEPRPAGYYRITAWIPPHLLRDGAMTVTAAIYSFQPRVVHFLEPDAVGFQMVESPGSVATRGEFPSFIGGVIRPLVPWTVDYSILDGGST